MIHRHISTKQRAPSWANRFYYDGLAEDADQAEWQAIVNGSAHITAGTIDDEMSEAADDDILPAVRDERLEGKNIALDQVQGRAAEIIIQRKALLNDLYPFKREENTLIYEGGAGRPPLYEFLLGVSQAHSLTSGNYVKLPRLFEQLSKVAAISFLGRHGKGLHTGWPRAENMGRFKTLMEHVRESSGKHGSEWQWSPGDDLPENPAPRLIKDSGLDIVAWTNWPDGRGAAIYLLGQCACGGDWLSKDKDLDLRTLWRWCKEPMVAPVRGFFTPHHATTPILHDLSPTAGLMFDRIRIVQCLSEAHVAQEVSSLLPSVLEGISIAKAPLTLDGEGEKTIPAAKTSVPKRRRAASRKT